jgi:hypothetical protein
LSRQETSRTLDEKIAPRIRSLDSLHLIELPTQSLKDPFGIENRCIRDNARQKGTVQTLDTADEVVIPCNFEKVCHARKAIFIPRNRHGQSFEEARVSDGQIEKLANVRILAAESGKMDTRQRRAKCRQSQRKIRRCHTRVASKKVLDEIEFLRVHLRQAEMNRQCRVLHEIRNLDRKPDEVFGKPKGFARNRWIRVKVGFTNQHLKKRDICASARNFDDCGLGFVDRRRLGKTAQLCNEIGCVLLRSVCNLHGNGKEGIAKVRLVLRELHC